MWKFIKKNFLVILAFLYLIIPLDIIPDPFYFEDIFFLIAAVARQIVVSRIEKKGQEHGQKDDTA